MVGPLEGLQMLGLPGREIALLRQPAYLPKPFENFAACWMGIEPTFRQSPEPGISAIVINKPRTRAEDRDGGSRRVQRGVVNVTLSSRWDWSFSGRAGIESQSGDTAIG